MPADDKSPHALSPPTERVGPTVCLIKPEGGDGMGHTARQRGRVRWRRDGKNNYFSFSSFITLILGCHLSTEHDSPVLTSLPLFLILLPSLHLCSFSASDEKIFATQFLSHSLSPHRTLTSQSTATEIQIHISNSSKKEVRLFFDCILIILHNTILLSGLLHRQDLHLIYDKNWNSLSWLPWWLQKVTMVKLLLACTVKLLI